MPTFRDEQFFIVVAIGMVQERLFLGTGSTWLYGAEGIFFLSFVLHLASPLLHKRAPL
jgi:hypothetical protein